MNKEIKILIVDDHDMVREGIKLLLLAHVDFPIQISTAISAKEAFKQCNNIKFDIVFMDIKMPEIDGITATKKIIEKWNYKVIALTMHSEIMFAEKMLEAGARGYLLKNSGPEELVAAIHRVLSGKIYYINEISNTLLETGKRYRTNKLSNKKQEQIISLTKRERDVLRLIALENTNEIIAKELKLSKRTIDNHRQNILKKCAVKNTAGLIRVAVDMNLV